MNYLFIGGIFMLWTIKNGYRIKVLKALMDSINFSKDKKNILSTVIARYIEYYDGRIPRVIIHEMSDYVEYACQLEPILYPLLSDGITRQEDALILNFAVIFGYQEVVKILLKANVKQDSFLMTKPYKLLGTDLYPINFAYYNGDVGMTRLLMEHCPKVKYTVNVSGSDNIIRVTTPMFGRETIYKNFKPKDEVIKKIVKTLNIQFPYLCADRASRNKVFYMLQDNREIIYSLKGGYIPKNASFTLDVSYSFH